MELPRILIVGTDSSVRNATEQTLRMEGFQVVTVPTYREAVLIADKEVFNLLIVDPHLSDVEGQDVYRLLRDSPKGRTTPVLALAGKNTNGLATRCLNSGADGFLHKQADGEELIAHVRALLRRPKLYQLENNVIQNGRITLRQGERRVLFDSKDVQGLTPKEYALLQALVLHSPCVVEKSTLVQQIWGTPLEQLGRKTLDVHIQRIRRKLGPLASSFLKTVSLVGYQWLETSNS